MKIEKYRMGGKIMDRICLSARLRTALLATFIALVVPASLLFAESRKETRVLTMGDPGSYLGIEMEDVTASNLATYKLNSEHGVIVRSVEKGSPAETASLKENDVILEFEGTPVLSAAQFSRLVKETPVGRKVDLVVSRDGKKINLSAKIGERDAAVHIGPFRRLPDLHGWQGFDLEGPDGHTFNFQMPRGPGNTFVIPKGGYGFLTAERPRLGVEVQALTPQLADFLGVSGKKGVLVSSVMEDSPATGKLKAGDVILKVDDKAVESPEDLTATLRKKEIGAKAELRIIRDKKEQTVTVELSKKEEPARKKGYSM